MNLADRAGLTKHDWYAPAAFTVTAFAIGIQAALLVQTAGGDGYPGEGRVWLAWASWLVLAAAVALHVPLRALTSPKMDLSRFKAWLARLPLRRHQTVVLHPAQDPHGDNGTTAEPSEAVAASTEVAQRLRVRVHTPLALGPAIAPGEPLPITINAEPVELVQDLQVRIEIEQGGRTRTSNVTMNAPNVVHSETLDEEGAFTLIVTVRHPHGEPATKRVRGRVVSYREEVGCLFDDLKATAQDAGLDVAAHSTPREAARALGSVRALPRDHIEGLVANLETALYDDVPVERATYETIYAILRKVHLQAKEVPN